MSDELKAAWDELQQHTDGWNWYWLSYGEKCYAFATVTAFPNKENSSLPPAGGRLEPHPKKEHVWVAEDGEQMIVDDNIASVERQNGDVICRFIATAYADAQLRFGSPASGEANSRERSGVGESEGRMSKAEVITLDQFGEILKLTCELGELKDKYATLLDCVRLYADKGNWLGHVFNTFPGDGCEPAQAALGKVDNDRL